MSSKNLLQPGADLKSEIKNFIERTTSFCKETEESSSERRESEREMRPMSLLIQCVDDSGMMIGNRFCTVSKDFSEDGIGFLHTEPITCDNLIITMTSAIGDEITVPGQLRHCTQVGSLGLVYQIGVAFTEA